MSPAATSQPTAAEWRDAFFAVETTLHRIESRVKLAEYLAGILVDDADKALSKKGGGGGLACLAEATARAVFHIADAMKEADAAYYETFNDLVERENAALARKGAA